MYGLIQIFVDLIYYSNVWNVDALQGQAGRISEARAAGPALLQPGTVANYRPHVQTSQKSTPQQCQQQPPCLSGGLFRPKSSRQQGKERELQQELDSEGTQARVRNLEKSTRRRQPQYSH